MVARRVLLRLGQLGGFVGDRRVGDLLEPAEQCLEAVMLQERAERRVGDALQLQLVERLRQRAVAFQRHQHPRHPRRVCLFDQIVAPACPS